MSEITTPQASPDPFPSFAGVSDREQVQFVTYKCLTCGEMGEWVLVIRDQNGRITQSSTFDFTHYKEKGWRKGNGHKKFHKFEVTRNHAEVAIL